jgi:hypothetical protein
MAVAMISLACFTTSCAAFVVRSTRRFGSPRMAWSDSDAAQVRKALTTPEQRSSFLDAVGMMDPDDFADSKIALALTIESASKDFDAYGLDEDELLTWRSLADDIVNDQFDGYRGDLLLAEAIIDRVGLIESKRLSNL